MQGMSGATESPRMQMIQDMKSAGMSREEIKQQLKASGMSHEAGLSQMQGKMHGMDQLFAAEGVDVSSLRSDIQSAVTSVLEGIGESDDASQDPRQAIREAISGVLEGYGINAENFRAAAGLQIDFQA